jgi:glycine dehydrogenase subunit 1
MGKTGLRQAAELCHHKSHYAAAALGQIAGVEINPQAPQQPFFKEFVARLPRPVAEVNRRLAEEFGIIGGYDLGADDPRWERHMLVAVTEMNTRAAIDQFAQAMGRILS